MDAPRKNITVGDMHNCDLNLSVEEKKWDNNSAAFYTHNLIIEYMSRIDTGFATKITILGVSKENLIAIRNDMQKLIDDIDWKKGQ